MNKFKELWNRTVAVLERSGDWVALLPLRLILAYEFGKAGMMKFNGNNWFGNVQENFPFPFNVVPVEISWFLATWAEILGAIGLVVGLFTRFWAFSLIILTIVAIFGVHWPDDWSSLGELWKGYAVTNKGFGNYRIPLLFLVMLLPLVFRGAGKLSLDYVLARYWK
ncbi:MAG: DoxX family protein [Woeseiaceae bacterium]|nr:DoxX family protein [Woeseiaceae bacterium]